VTRRLRRAGLKKGAPFKAVAFASVRPPRISGKCSASAAQTPPIRQVRDGAPPNPRRPRGESGSSHHPSDCPDLAADWLQLARRQTLK
jgi:hypothetical protein